MYNKKCRHTQEDLEIRLRKEHQQQHRISLLERHLQASWLNPSPIRILFYKKVIAYSFVLQCLTSQGYYLDFTKMCQVTGLLLTLKAAISKWGSSSWKKVSELLAWSPEGRAKVRLISNGGRASLTPSLSDWQCLALFSFQSDHLCKMLLLAKQNLWSASSFV